MLNKLKERASAMGRLARATTALVLLLLLAGAVALTWRFLAPDYQVLFSELDAQDARTEQAAIAYEKAVQTAFGEAENSLVLLAADRRRVQLLDAGEDRAERAYEASRKGYVAGVTDLQTTLNNEQAWRSVRTQETAAQVQALRRAVQTYKALGGGWPLQSAPTNQEAR